MDSITGMPKEMSGTKIPSITSIWRYRAPARSTSLICSPSLQKSAAKIEGDKILFIPAPLYPPAFYALLDNSLHCAHSPLRILFYFVPHLLCICPTALARQNGCLISRSWPENVRQSTVRTMKAVLLPPKNCETALDRFTVFAHTLF